LGRAHHRVLAAQGYETVSFDPRPSPDGIQYYPGSILDLANVEAAVDGADVVFHFAGLLGTSELLSQSPEAVDVNVKGTANVMEACRRRGVRTVFYPTKPNDWLNTYSITKKAGEEFARLYASQFGMDVRILRWLNAYGPGQKAYPVRKAVPLMILQGLHDLDIEIWGTGEQTVDLIYTADLARNTVLYTLNNNGDATVRDTGNTLRMTVNELASLIHDMTGSQAGLRHLPMRAGEDLGKPVRLLPGKTAADLLGVADTTTPIELGMAATITYYRDLPIEDRLKALQFYGAIPEGSISAAPAALSVAS
jgi:nucleoside-diphosphate-sugar epimerase